MVLSLTVVSVSAKEVAKVNLPDTLMAGQEKLILNGAGIRQKFFMDIYVAGLYLKAKNQNAEQILAADEAMAVRLQVVSNMLTPERMTDAVREGFEKSTDGQIEPIRERMEQFIAVFKNGIQPNDFYDIIYQPLQGIEVFKNGQSQAKSTGLDFKKALFGIWLGAKPAQKDLKKKMLAQERKSEKRS
jgi:hypothetical protein